MKDKEKLIEEYPVGAMVEIRPYRHEWPAPVQHGIIVENDHDPDGFVRCFVHTTEGSCAYWSSTYLKVVGKAIKKGER
jgi:hypothetical protein